MDPYDLAGFFLRERCVDQRYGKGGAVPRFRSEQRNDRFDGHEIREIVKNENSVLPTQPLARLPLFR